MIRLYNILLAWGSLAGLPLIVPLVLTSRKRRKTVLQRLGLSGGPGRPVSAGGGRERRRPLWIHALSVGEVLSVLPLVKAMVREHPGRPLVFSASTLTGFQIAEKRLGGLVDAVRYFPYDFPFSVRRAADAVDPAMVAIVETDIWPNFLVEMQRRSVPVVLLNTRLSARSFKGYRLLGDFSRRMLSTFTRICTQTAEDGERFRRLGVPPDRVVVTGNLKFDREVTDGTPGTALSRKTLHFPGERPVVCAGSTHSGEEAVLLDAAARVKALFPGVRWIIAPRDPERARRVLRLCRENGMRAALLGEVRTDGAPRPCEAVVVDTMGMLTELYAVSDIAFVGGSLTENGGHNPLEPASFAKPVLFGPDMSDFAWISRRLLESGAAFQVDGAAGLAASLAELLGDPEKRAAAGGRALAVFRTHRGAVGTVLRILDEVHAQHESSTPDR